MAYYRIISQDKKVKTFNENDFIPNFLEICTQLEQSKYFGFIFNESSTSYIHEYFSLNFFTENATSLIGNELTVILSKPSEINPASKNQNILEQFYLLQKDSVAEPLDLSNLTVNIDKSEINFPLMLLFKTCKSKTGELIVQDCFIVSLQEDKEFDNIEDFSNYFESLLSDIVTNIGSNSFSPNTDCQDKSNDREIIINGLKESGHKVSESIIISEMYKELSKFVEEVLSFLIS